ncbi:MAG: gliding-motility protein MglA [Sandaracinaceae bacterium]|nr:gliding-motility protein MglA [Sandaracinaceae bacterium]
MPVVSHARKDIHFKIVYYGPGLGGKTTNLEFIHARSEPQHRGKLISLTNEAERTLFFDLLPVHLGKFRGYDIRLQLCTVPGQIAQDKTRRTILRHVDGVVFVVDSQPGRMDANVQSIRNLEQNLALQGDDPDTLPLVVQYNKRDLPGVLSVAELRRALNVPRDVPEVEAAALLGRGVFETLKRTVRGCLAVLGEPSRLPEGRTQSELPQRRASMLPEGRARAESVPRAPAVPRIDK